MFATIVLNLVIAAPGARTAMPPLASAPSLVGQSSESLCSSATSPPQGKTLWNVADNLFEQGRDVAAARSYYQLFRCGQWSPINPLVSDKNQLVPFDTALRQATAGNFALAASDLQHILKVLPEFGEARLLMGVFQWAAGMHAEARATWRATITAPYFTLPPDFDQIPYVVTEAKKFLRWSSAH